MSYNVNHIHLKSEDPKSTADWFVKAFNVEIISDTVQVYKSGWEVLATPA